MQRPELVIGLIGPLGVDLDQIHGMLGRSLGALGYSSEKIVLSDALSEKAMGLKSRIRDGSEYDRIVSRMNAGDELRARAGGGAAAILASMQIQKSRRCATGSNKEAHHNYCYVLKSLKHIDEVRSMRKIYGRSFLLVSVYLSREKRLDLLSKVMARDRAEELVDRDYHDDTSIHGQSVREAFPEGDVFVDSSCPDTAEGQINRFVEVVFGNTFHTPSVEESGMHHAFTSSLKSSSLSRQVGAAIENRYGDLISTGTNEVPKAGGGIYTEGDPHDKREFRMGYDHNQQKRNDMLMDMLSRLERSGWVPPEHLAGGGEDMLRAALGDGTIRKAKFMDLTEYGREVHAEMDALVGAARRNESIRGCTMYCTTFPCHMCTKHIVASGIKKVVFIEPYPKSHASDLFQDSISVGDPARGKVHLKHYFGISPKLYVDFFTMCRRKDATTGRMIEWDASTAKPRFWEPGSFFEGETAAIEALMKSMNVRDEV